MEGQKHPNSHEILTVVYDIKKKQLYQYWKTARFQEQQQKGIPLQST
jgi:hypothetical protein